MPTQSGNTGNNSRSDKVLYLHIGFGKTGTSSLQSFFARNMERLASLGIYYPFTGRRELDAHHYIATAARPGGGTGYDTDISWEDYVSHLRDEIADRSEPNVLISSEVFSGKMIWRSLAMLKDIFSEIRVVSYLRRQDVLIASNYNQWVKSENLTKSLSELKLLPFNFDFWTETWERFLGTHPGRLVVRPYEQGQLENNNVIDDFMKFNFGIKFDDSFAPPSQVQANQRLSLDALEFKRVVNCLCPSNISSAFVGPLMKYSKRVFSVAPEDEGAIFSPRERRKIMEVFDAGNATVARRYLSRPDGILFKQPLPSAKTSWRPPKLKFAGARDIAQFILADRACPEACDEPPAVIRSDVATQLDDIVRACPLPLIASGERRIQALVRGVATALCGDFPERSEEDVLGLRWAKQ